MRRAEGADQQAGVAVGLHVEAECRVEAIRVVERRHGHAELADRMDAEAVAPALLRHGVSCRGMEFRRIAVRGAGIDERVEFVRAACRAEAVEIGAREHGFHAMPVEVIGVHALQVGEAAGTEMGDDRLLFVEPGAVGRTELVEDLAVAGDQGEAVAEHVVEEAAAAAGLDHALGCQPAAAGRVRVIEARARRGCGASGGRKPGVACAASISRSRAAAASGSVMQMTLPSAIEKSIISRTRCSRSGP